VSTNKKQVLPLWFMPPITSTGVLQEYSTTQHS